MYELLLCHRRAHWVTPGAFFDHWRGRRREVVAELRPALRYAQYVQLERASRLNILYLAIRASRSWPVTALLAALQRLPLPSLFSGSEGDERWDVVESLRYVSRDDLDAALSSLEGADALERLRADALGRVRNSATLVTEDLVVSDDRSLGYPRTVTRFCLRARAPLTHAQMLERWKTAHKALVTSLQAPLGYREYDQLYVEPAPQADQPGFDAVAVLAYGAESSLLRRLVNVRTQLANFRLVKDEVHFIDLGRSALVFGTETVC